MATEARLKANAKYDAENTKRYGIKLNLTTDADIITMLDVYASAEEGGKQGYIKDLIRKDIAERGLRLP